MKQHAVYTALLVLALLVVGLSIFCNMAVQGSYPVTITYRLPAASGIVRQEQQTTLQQTYLYTEEESAPDGYYAQSGAAGALTSVTFPLELNSATEEQLKFIPQVGDVMAARIVQYREYLGRYTSLEQLHNIKGVGSKTYQKLIAYLYLQEWEPTGGQE